MSPKQAKTLRMNDRLRWEDEGFVIEGIVDDVGYAGLRIKWDDGLTAHLLHKDNDWEFLKYITKVRQ